MAFSTFEIVKNLAKKQGISLTTLEEKLGLGKNSLYGLKRNQPSAERLQEIADYFNVSTDYLLGRESYDIMKLNQARKDFTEDLIEEEEKQALIMFRKETEGMTKSEKERFNKALSGMMQTARSLIVDENFWKD